MSEQRSGTELAAQSGVPVYWRGPSYGQNLLALRVLILGESHIGDLEATDTDATTRTVQGRIDHLNHGQFFSIIEQIVLGRKPLVFEISRLWESVAFANYAPVQVVRGEVVGLRHFAGARARFIEMVTELEPDLVCFFSAQAWNNRPVAREASWRDRFGADPEEIEPARTIYPCGDRKMLAAKFNHPRGLRAPISEWHRTFADVVIEATKLKYALGQAACSTL